jgi:hypothetical protein
LILKAALLQQLPDGYVNRRDIPFVYSIALVGMPNIRDYKSDIREEEKTLGSASPFHIVKTAKTLRNFTIKEVTRLYAQHTKVTRQVFSEAVVQKAFSQSQGQPWLVNAIACEIVEQICEVSEILPKHVEQAIQAFIQRRDTH